MTVSALLAVAAVPTAAPLAAAQDTVTVSGEVTCADCRIVADTVVTIGGLDGPGLETVHPLSMVSVDRRNRIFGTAVLEGDAVAFAAMVGTRAQAGYRFHVLDTLGAFRSFGLGPPESFWGTAQGGNLLFTATKRNEILRWNLDPEPTLVEVLRRRVAEFDRHLHLGPLDYPVISGIRHDSDGLWIVWNAPDPEAPKRDPDEGVRLELSSQSRDGWIDLVDPATGLTITRYRGDASLKGFAHGSRYVVVYEETEAGVPYIHLLEPRLVRGVGAAR